MTRHLFQRVVTDIIEAVLDHRATWVILVRLTGDQQDAASNVADPVTDRLADDVGRLNDALAERDKLIRRLEATIERQAARLDHEAAKFHVARREAEEANERAQDTFANIAMGACPGCAASKRAPRRYPAPEGSTPGIEIVEAPEAPGATWVRLPPNGVLAEHTHHNADERCHVLEGTAEFACRRPGVGASSCIQPCGARARAGDTHSITAGPEGALLLCVLVDVRPKT